MALKRREIDYIRFDLLQRGLARTELFEELLDHICCEVELKTENGILFKKALEEVLANIDPSHWPDLQNKVLLSDNYSPALMLKNIIKMMFRNMKKHRAYAAINIIGLSLGLSCFIVIALYVNHERGFDKMFTQSSSIYRITASSMVGGANNHIPTTFAAFGPELKERFAEVSNYTRIINYKYTRMVPTFRYNEKIFYEEHVILADSTFFELFNFSFIEGNPATAMSNPSSVVLTASVARKYFGDESALGKHLQFNNAIELEVTGVLRDLPSNTHLQFEFVIPMSSIANSGVFRSADVLDSFSIDWFWTYMTINDPTKVKTVEAGINAIAAEKIADQVKDFSSKFYLQSLNDVHLHSEFDYNTDLTQNGNIKNLFIFISVGVLVLIISAINFINLTMATASRRFKEIGISKVLGALKVHLRMQFILESVMICIISLLIACMLLPFILPLFGDLLGVSLSIDLQNNTLLIGAILVFTIIVGIVSGAYPAFFVASFEPQAILKGVWKSGKGGSYFRKTLVGAQIAISIFLIIGTIVISEQLRFIHEKSLGFDKDQIIMVTVRGTSIPKSYSSFKNNLLSENSIASVSSVSEPIGREVQFMSFEVEGQEKTQYVKILNVTHDFVKTMGLEIVQGRDFSRDHVTDSTSGFIINEAAARAFGWNDPIGKALDHSLRPVKQGRVIGMVKDFNFEPLQKKIDPIIIWYGVPYWYVAIKTEKAKTNEAIVALERNWKKFEPEKPLSFHFLDQSIDQVYNNEKRLSNVFMIFALLSVFTAVLGLYGLISFVAEQRLGEIGIRKVMGASVKSILYLISKEYIVLVAIAFLLAAPATYMILNQWLMNFAFHISWSLLYFVAGLVISGSIVVITVVLKAAKAARTNPVDILKYE